MRTWSLIASGLMLCVGVATAAPAPLPRPDPHAAEVVFDAQTKERARLAQVRLRTALLEVPAQKGPLPSLNVRSDGALVRVRLGGRADALLLLAATAKVLSDPFADSRDGEKLAQRRLAAAMRDRCELRLRILRRVQELGEERDGLGADLRRMEESLARFEFEAEPLKVVTPPRAVRRGR